MLLAVILAWAATRSSDGKMRYRITVLPLVLLLAGGVAAAPRASFQSR